MGAHILLALHEKQTRAEGDGAQAVEECVQPRQEDPPLRQCGRWVVYIEEPEQKGDSTGARRNNGAYSQTLGEVLCCSLTLMACQ